MIYKGILPGDRVWIIGDTHFGHANIIRYCNRPFRTAAEMDREMIKRWNAVVGGQDMVIFAGDFRYGLRARAWDWYARRLHGEKMYLKGNHDTPDGGRPLLDAMVITYEGEKFLIIHDPEMAPYDWKGWIIHGHVHNNNLTVYPLISWRGRRINISAEMINYQPVRFEALADLAMGQEEGMAHD